MTRDRHQGPRRRARALAIGVAIGLAATGCGLFGGGSSGAGAPAAATTAAANASGADPASSTGAATGGPCPANLVIQTDWLPEVEHGGLYELIGPGGHADKATMTYSGPLKAEYRGATGVQTVEIRAGGAAIDNKAVADVMLADDDIYLGSVNTDDAIAARGRGEELIGVASTLDLSPQMLMWSPSRYTISQFADLAATRAKVLYFPGSTYIDFLVSRGYLTQDQLDPSYDGSPDRWLATKGDVIQQGFATNEVYQYEHELAAWRKPVDFFLIHWMGYENYPAMLTTFRDRLDRQRPCLRELVPVLQRAWVAFLANPEPVSRAIVDIDNAYDTFFKVSPGLNDEALAKMRQYQIASNGSDATYGNFDIDRVGRFIGIVQDIYRRRGNPLPAGITADEVATNEFVDPAVSLPAR